jgi:hypothetical protein
MRAAVALELLDTRRAIDALKRAEMRRRHRGVA